MDYESSFPVVGVVSGRAAQHSHRRSSPGLAHVLWPSLGQGCSEALKVFGEPDIRNKAIRQWNPSSRTGYRMVIAELGYSPSQGRNTVLRVTVYPHPSDVLNVTEFLHQPKMFIFEPGHSDKTGSSLAIETRDRQMKFNFLCAAGHDPQFQSVTIKSIKSPDADPL